MRISENQLPATGEAGVYPRALLAPAIRLAGNVDDGMLDSFFKQRQAALDKEGGIVVQLTTHGGDADIGRRIGEEIRMCRDYLDREWTFLGASSVYSSGVTIMSAFPKARRFLTRDAVLLIHGRKIKAEAIPAGFLPAALQFTRSKVAEFENGLRLQREGFLRLIEGSSLTIEEVEEKALTNWYVDAGEALRLGLVGGII